MKSISSKIPDVKILIPDVFSDDRGFFLESYNYKIFAQIGIHHVFVQDNHSHSLKNVLRGLHFQLNHPQGKLLKVLHGEIFDVVVDLRKNSSTYGHWTGEILSAKNFKMLWIPPEFAHGFLTLSDSADIVYKTTEYYDPVSEHTLRWDDPHLAIKWPSNTPPILSVKDSRGQTFHELEMYFK